ncbi:MAG: dienelactone hydrolase family protein [Rhodobacteraceae bacterium]|nr:dienelactone hydrolase family protein [Paracoccaceae bacterium]
MERVPFGYWFLDDLEFDTPRGVSGVDRKPPQENQRVRGAGSADVKETQSGRTRIPGVFLRPAPGIGPVPAVVYAHAHGKNYAVGRDELLQGRGALVGPYAPDLAGAGIAALSIDMPCFGARQNPGEERRAKAALWRRETLFGQMLAELSAAVDFLRQQDVIDPDRIGAMGFSMGSTHAWWLAALDPRVKAAVALSSFADLDALVESGAHEGHGIYMMVPGLLERASTGEVAALAAPKPLFFGAGFQDWSTPEPAFQRALDQVLAGYGAARDRVEWFVDPELGHQETPEMRAAVMDFLKRRL